MIKQNYVDIYEAEAAADAILNLEHPGFKEDYIMLHCLLRKYKPKTVFEIGTNKGTGTKIIKNAVGNTVPVYSLDLPMEAAHGSLKAEGIDRVGEYCNLPFTQLRGDSMKFDFQQWQAEAYFIDGAHDYDHPYHETKEVLRFKPKLIVYHDSDIKDVYEAIVHAFDKNKDYDLYRIVDTRIAYAVRKS